MLFRKHRLAYLFERFPSFSQTFCVREITGLEDQGLHPLIYSIRDPGDEPDQDFPTAYRDQTVYLPASEPLTQEMKDLHSKRELPRPMRVTLREWPYKIDKHRIYEAAWLGPRLRDCGIGHVHVHFAGMAARTAYWLKRFYRISYSFTGHANDIFTESDHPISLADLVREAALVVTVSDFSAARLQAQFPEKASRIHRVYNGIRLEDWQGESAPARPFRIVTVGRYIEKKGFNILVDACDRLQRDRFPFECFIVGEGPLRPDLEARIARAGLGNRVHLTGSKTESEVRDLLHTATAFALPCVTVPDGDQDNLPTVLVEAMACGLPVVSTPVAGVPEMVEHERTGLLVGEQNPEELAEALARLLKDPKLARDYGTRGLAKARVTFAVEKTAHHLKHLLVRYAKVTPSFEALKKDPALLRSLLGF